MKKSSFVALVLGTVSGVLFSLGMCMALIQEWNAGKPGIVLGSVGLMLGLVTVLVWRKLEGKKPIKISGRMAAAVLLAIFGALTFGIGMCFCMVWNKLAVGIVIGLAGIVGLLFLIPLTVGIKE